MTSTAAGSTKLPTPKASNPSRTSGSPQRARPGWRPIQSPVRGQNSPGRPSPPGSGGGAPSAASAAGTAPIQGTPGVAGTTGNGPDPYGGGPDGGGGSNHRDGS